MKVFLEAVEGHYCEGLTLFVVEWVLQAFDCDGHLQVVYWLDFEGFD